VATDLDTSWMPPDASFSVERRDVATDPPPAGPFDLVHARLVLTHVPERDEALRRMASALRPGGWLVIEDFDVSVQPRACPDAATAEEDRANRLREGFIELLVQRGVDLTLGRTLRRRLLGLGLTDVGAEAYAPLAVPATRRLEIANTLQVRAGLEALGLGVDVAAHLDDLAAGRLDIATPPLITAWGRCT
jgi:SAM-dependent methyltransferase